MWESTLICLRLTLLHFVEMSYHAAEQRGILERIVSPQAAGIKPLSASGGLNNKNHTHDQALVILIRRII